MRCQKSLTGAWQHRFIGLAPGQVTGYGKGTESAAVIARFSSHDEAPSGLSRFHEISGSHFQSRLYRLGAAAGEVNAGIARAMLPKRIRGERAKTLGQVKTCLTDELRGVGESHPAQLFVYGFTDLFQPMP